MAIRHTITACMYMCKFTCIMLFGVAVALLQSRSLSYPHAGCALIQDWRAGNATKGTYRYMSDHLSIEASHFSHPPALPSELRYIMSLLKLDRWTKFMHLHPDWRFADYILEGIRQGFHIGYAHSSFH